MLNTPIFTVSSLSSAIKNTIESAFGQIKVRGEVTNSRAVGVGGHVYFDLKEEQSVLKSVVWKSQLARLGVKPENGMELQCTGRLTTWGGQSVYQLVVEKAELAGQGAMLALLEKRKKQLEAEGLFDAAHKKPLPFLPRRLGIITSPTGAVLQDILHRLADRFPLFVLLAPVQVQGAGAEFQIAAAVELMGSLPLEKRPDTLIIARGGGSLEDLWCFNEEMLLRAVYACPIPVISAIGHETDTTLIDYVADKRAPTPTAAAEMAVPVRAELQLKVAEHTHRLSHAIGQKIHASVQQLEMLGRRQRTPMEYVERQQQRLDMASERLQNIIQQHLVRREGMLSKLEGSLTRQSPLAHLSRSEQKLAQLQTLLTRVFQKTWQPLPERLAMASALLESYSYTRTLERGFALVFDAQKTLVSKTTQAASGASLTLQLQDGTITVTAC